MNVPPRVAGIPGLILGLALIFTSCQSAEEDAAPPETAPETVMAPPATTAPPAAQIPQESGDPLDRARAAQEKRAELVARDVALGRQLMADGRLEDARSAFSNALLQDPTHEEAKRLYDQVTGLLGDPGAAARADHARAFDEQMARFEQAQVLSREWFRKGQIAHQEKRYDEAIDAFEKCLAILRYNPSVDADFDEPRVRAAIDTVRAEQSAFERETEAQRLREIQAAKAAAEQAEREKVERRILTLWERAVEQFEQERFDAAARICDEILILDHRHEHAQKMKQAAVRARHQFATEKNVQEMREYWQRWIQEVKELGMPQVQDVIFPDRSKWMRISERGPIELAKGDTQEPEADRAVKSRLALTVFPKVEWEDTALDAVITFLRNNTGINFFVSKAVREKSPDELKVSLTFREVSAEAALRNVVDNLKLAYTVADGMVQITTAEDLRRSKVVEFYDVRDLTAKIGNFPGIDINLNPSGAGAGASMEEEEDAGGEELKTIETDRLIDMIKQAVDPVSWNEDTSNTIVDKSGTLVVRQTPENQRRIRKLLADIRRSTGVGVMIESRFLTVENNFLQDIGVDFRGLGDNTAGVGRPGLGTPAPFDDFGTTGTGVGTPVSPVGIGGDNTAGAFFTDRRGRTDIRGRSESLFDEVLGNPEVLDNAGGLALQWTYLDDTQLEAILRAVQKYERVNTVTAPKLLVANTQRAHLSVLNEISYIKDFDVEIAQAAVIADPIVDKITEGVVLDVRPIVSNDRRFVTLELRPIVATLLRPIRTFTTTLAVGTAVTFQLPELRVQKVKTTVVVPDGGTLLLGGLKFNEEKTLEAGIPVLKDIPILSFFFERKGKYTNLKDLLILLKVRILINEELEPDTTARPR